MVFKVVFLGVEKVGPTRTRSQYVADTSPFFLWGKANSLSVTFITQVITLDHRLAGDPTGNPDGLNTTPLTRVITEDCQQSQYYTVHPGERSNLLFYKAIQIPN